MDADRRGQVDALTTSIDFEDYVMDGFAANFAGCECAEFIKSEVCPSTCAKKKLTASLPCLRQVCLKGSLSSPEAHPATARATKLYCGAQCCKERTSAAAEC
jgi:hypothetical protein